MKTNTMIPVLLAILCGVLACACHSYSVEQHKMHRSANPEPTHYLMQMETYEMPISPDVKLLKKYDDPDIPDDIEEACQHYGEEYGISVEFLEALIWRESRYQADVVSADGNCIGLCQVNPSCHKQRMKSLGVEDLTDARQNIAVAADYLAEIFEEHPDPAEALMVYNGDSRWKKGKVSKYAKDIILKSEELKVKHENQDRTLRDLKGY